MYLFHSAGWKLFCFCVFVSLTFTECCQEEWRIWTKQVGSLFVYLSALFVFLSYSKKTKNKKQTNKLVNEFFDVVDLWVVKLKKSPWSFAYVVRRDHVNRARSADHAARTCDKFFFSIIKITRFIIKHDIRLRNSPDAQRYVICFLIVLFGKSWCCCKLNVTFIFLWQLGLFPFRMFFEALYLSLDCTDSDVEALFVLCLIYASLKNKGVFETLHPPHPPTSTPTHPPTHPLIHPSTHPSTHPQIGWS